jgi:hypothetical protein
MKLYLAGPMTGYPLFNFPAFDEAARRGRELGFVIVSPAEIDRFIGFDEHCTIGHFEPRLADYFDTNLTILRDVGLILTCDGIALLPGWSRSKGATAEMCVARWAGKTLYDAGSFREMNRIGLDIQ